MAGPCGSPLHRGEGRRGRQAGRLTQRGDAVGEDEAHDGLALLIAELYATRLPAGVGDQFHNVAPLVLEVDLSVGSGATGGEWAVASQTGRTRHLTGQAVPVVADVCALRSVSPVLPRPPPYPRLAWVRCMLMRPVLT
jgi:hypothetical protein